jgi:hypothetical protein
MAKDPSTIIQRWLEHDPHVTALPVANAEDVAVLIDQLNPSEAWVVSTFSRYEERRRQT